MSEEQNILFICTAYRETAAQLRHRLLQWMEQTRDPVRRRAAYFFNRYEPQAINYTW